MADVWDSLYGDGAVGQEEEEELLPAPPLSGSASAWDSLYPEQPAQPAPMAPAPMAPAPVAESATGIPMPMPNASANLISVEKPDFKQAPEFASLFQLRRDRQLYAGNPAMAAQAQQQDRALVEQLTTQHDITEPELAEALTGLLTRAADTPEGLTRAAAVRLADVSSGRATDEAAQADVSAANNSDFAQAGKKVVRQFFGGTARFVGDTIEPVNLLQEIGGTVLKADLQSTDMPVGKKLGHIYDELGKIDYQGYLDGAVPFLHWSGRTRQADRNHSGEENLRLMAELTGTEDKISDRAFKVAGIASDVFVDPLMMGAYLRGVGNLARLPAANAKRGARWAAEAGAATGTRATSGPGKFATKLSAEADAVTRMGDDVERALSPAGVGRGIGRVVPQSVKDEIGSRMEGVLEKVLNFEVNTGAIESSTPRTTVARLVSGDGGAFWNQKKDYLVGAPNADEFLEASEEGITKTDDVRQFVGRPVTGTRTPREMTDSMRRGEFVADQAIGALQSGFAKLYSRFGNEKAQRWLKGVEHNLSGYRRIMDSDTYRKYDQETTDALMNLAIDTTRNVGIANRPGALKQLDNLSQRNLAARNLYAKTGRPSPYMETIGGELRQAVDAAPKSSSLIDRANSERIAKLAQQKGMEPRELLKVYDDTVDTLIAQDVMLGYHNTLYAPVKDTFYEDVARRLGNSDEAFDRAEELWDNVLAAAARGEDAGEIGLTSDLRILKPYGPKGARNELDEMDPEGMVVIDKDGNPKQAKLALKVKQVLGPITGGLAVDMNDYFRDIAQGHFRNSYAAHQSKRDPQRFLRALEEATIIRSPVLTKGSYRKGLVDAGYDRESQLITRYVESIAPSRRGERGLVVRSNNIMNHLIDNGVDRVRARDATAKLQKLVSPENLGDLVDGSFVAQNYISRKAGRSDTGFGIGGERTRPKYPTNRGLKTLENPEGFAEDFPKAYLNLNATAQDRRFLELENQRLSQIQTRLNTLRQPVVSGDNGAVETVAESATATGYNYRADVQVQQMMAENKYGSGYFRNRLGHTTEPADFWGAARFTAKDGQVDLARSYATKGLAEARTRGDGEAVAAFEQFLGGLGVKPTTGTVAESATVRAEIDALEAEFSGMRKIRENRNATYTGDANTVSREEWQANMDAYELDRSLLGQLYDPMVSLGEGAEYLKRHYPVRQFTLDTYTLARRGGYVKRLSQDPKRGGVPEGWVPIEQSSANAHFGPFAGMAVHPALHRDLNNALLSDAQGRMNALGRLNSAVTGGFIASPKSIANNFIGGLFVSHQYGNNPVAVLNEWTNLISDVQKAGKQNIPEFEEVGHLLGAQSKALALAKSINTNKLDVSGFGKPGFSERMQEWAQRQIEAPMGQGWLGLDWFQAVEDTLKMANYRVALKKFDGDKEKALEFTRNVLFDYGQLPEAARMARDKGMLTFPGFPLFMTGRMLGTAVQNPGRIAPYTRVPEAMWNLHTEDEESKYAATAAMPKYLQDMNAMPIRRQDGNGGEIFSVIPSQVWFPTNQLDRENMFSPINENLMSFGVGRAIVDVATAVANEGVPAFGQKYGQQVFTPGIDRGSQVLQTGAFLAGQYSPALIKNAINYNPNRVNPENGINMGSPWAGTAVDAGRAVGRVLAEDTRNTFDYLNMDDAAPGLTDWIHRNVLPLDQEAIDTLRQAQKDTRRKINRSWFDNVTGLIMPTPTPISLEPQTNSARHKRFEYDRQDQNRQEEIDRQRQGSVIDMLLKRENPQRLQQLADEALRVGKESITLENGETVQLSRSTLDTLAQGIYWNSYQQRQGGQ